MSASSRKTLAVVAARGGSKGIPRKNLIDLCGKPLLAWTVEQAVAAHGVTDVAVSSDDAEILAVARDFGAIGVPRPDDISGDRATSESAWRHAYEALARERGPYDRIVALQATSPIREPADIDGALALYDGDAFDSVLSVCEVEDFFTWRRGPEGAEAVNYDWRSRRRRQEIEPRYLENGSIYAFPPDMLLKTDNRLGGRIGLYVMERHKTYQVDRPEDLALCAAIMRGYGYA